MRTTENFTNGIKERTGSLGPLSWQELDNNFKYGNSWQEGKAYKAGMVVWYNDFMSTPNNPSGEMSQWLCKNDHTGASGNTPGTDGKWERLTSSGIKQGTNYVMVYGTSTPIDNGIELLAAYELAKTMSPSVDNRITVVIAPGYYDLYEDVFLLDTSYIDVTSLTGERDVIIDISNGGGFGIIDIIENNITITGLVSYKSHVFSVGNDLPNVVIKNCKGGDYSFGKYYNPTAQMSISSIYIDCEGGNYSFGYSPYTNSTSTLAGTYINCKGGDYSFGVVNAIEGELNINAYFKNCTAGDYSFGVAIDYVEGEYPDEQSRHVIINGTFEYCKGGMYCFAVSEVNCSLNNQGVFNNCKGGNICFNCIINIINNSMTTSATFKDCTAGTNSFIYSEYIDPNTSTSYLDNFYYCVAGSDSFASGVNTNNSSISKFYYCKCDSSNRLLTTQPGVFFCVVGSTPVTTIP